MIKYGLLIVFVCFTQLLHSQSAVEEYRINRQIAFNHITALKNGALLVRLKTKEKSIEAYYKSGAFSLAKKIEAEQAAENRLIMSMFKEHFTFCPVYFFYTHHTKQVQAGVKQGIFLNNDLQPDPTIVLPADTFYIAEIDALLETLPDEEPDEPDSQPADKQSQHAHTTLQRVLVIKDQNLIQLRRPFPFYVRLTFDQFMYLKFEKLNHRLHRFYQEASR